MAGCRPLFAFGGVVLEIRRSAGILMPLSALPSPHGIGTLGKSAYKFVDFLFDANQSWWQILPVGPTSYGDSPYQSFSAFAGNPYYIDLDMLVEDGLLKKNEIKDSDFGTDTSLIDYAKLYKNRFTVLRRAKERGIERDRAELNKFREENFSWLFDYALFMALKYHFDMKPWTEWEDEDIKFHRPEAIKKYSEMLSDDIEFFEYLQFLFMKQWRKLRAYAKERGIGIIGDIPIYVALDSADVWGNSEFFELDENNLPVEVAGVPPDYFCEDGQLWGNPLYDWERMKADGYGWWIRRIDGALKLYDVLRIDHFRGFESYWAVPYGEKTARKGQWKKGPGIDFVHVLTSWFAGTQFIAEDLGVMTDGVRQLLKDSGLPGMKVLEFAFTSTDPSEHLPHTYTRNSVCYVATHDNATLKEWQENEKEKNIKYAKEYLGYSKDEGLNWCFIRNGMASVSDLFIVQIQDYLNLGSAFRTNKPGILGGNWQWRLNPSLINKQLIKKISRMTKIYGRGNVFLEAYKNLEMKEK